MDNNKNRTHTHTHTKKRRRMGEKSLTGFLKVIGFRDSVEKGESSTTASLQKHCYKTALAKGGLLLLHGTAKNVGGSFYTYILVCWSLT